MPRLRWKPIRDPRVLEGYLISQYGDIKAEGSDDDKSFRAEYHSTNGYDFAPILNADEHLQLFPIDELIASAFIPVPHELKGKFITVNHINGDTRDISLDNLEWVEDVEIWKPITDIDVEQGRYEVSNHGNIRNVITGNILKGNVLKNYLAVHLKPSIIIDENHQSIQRNMNRLVAAEFVGGFSVSRCVVNHIDGNKLNDYAKNLEWVSYSENARHSYLIGHSKIRKGEDAFASKITEELAKKIWLLLIDDPTELNGRPETNGAPSVVYEYLKDDYPKLTKAIIQGIKSSRCWGNTTFDSNKVFNNQQITEDIVKKIWMLLIDDYESLHGRPCTDGSASVVHKYLKEDGVNVTNVSLAKIWQIKVKYAWTHVTDKLPQKEFKNLRNVVTPILAKKIWLLLTDDPTELNGRPETKGSSTAVYNYLKDEYPYLNLANVESIKYGAAWTNITGLQKKKKGGKM